MFEIKTAIAATLASLTNRSEIHGVDKAPAVTAWFEAEVEITFLDQLGDGNLRFASYYGDDKQADVPGVPKTTPYLRSTSVSRVIVEQKALVGWVLKADHGINESAPVTFGACKCDGFSFVPKKYTILLKWRVSTNDVTAESLGLIGMKVGQQVMVALDAPEVQEEKTTDKGAPLFEGDGDEAAPARKPAAAERAAMAKVKGGKAPAPAKPSKTKLRQQAEDAFKKDKEVSKPIVTTKRTRTPRGAAATAAFLAANGAAPS